MVLLAHCPTAILDDLHVIYYILTQLVVCHGIISCLLSAHASRSVFLSIWNFCLFHQPTQYYFRCISIPVWSLQERPRFKIIEQDTASALLI